MSSRSLKVAVTSAAALALNLQAPSALGAPPKDVPGHPDAGAAAAGEGDAGNRGTVWLSEAAGEGHGNDPHVACGAIVVWADKLAEAGTYVVSLQPPTGDRSEVAGGTWAYPAAGPRPIAGLDGSALAEAAARLGVAPHVRQGYHFKLDVSQNGHFKHKVFWVDCPVESAAGPAPSAPVAAPAASGAEASSETLGSVALAPAAVTPSAALEAPSAAGDVVAPEPEPGAPAEGTREAQVLGVSLVRPAGLPFTGGDWALLVGIGAALLGAGTGILRLRRRTGLG